ncbi:telomere repeats-binding bouquet formation protein 1 isoform X3 [Betta splendens]|uniref:Telomere repeats-binding bouquet formation protein 1 isoform X3 n=1 Tax=Betta splendens TaxID=158456 RepID=A0A9W2XUJ3_BETSP|nr:telomere repeats-binding bouquet formation protein 1 isoform X3 [Betta splendens]
MDKHNRNTVRTDLSLLLECLKFQMKSPDLQKQALVTIHSICEKREDNVELLREMGGVPFIYNLSKSSIVHADVTETALFTLGTLAEANVYCKNSLCRKETFADLAGCLMREDIPLTQKTVSVYLLSVLVANNKSGQTLAQMTGCLDILLNLFRTTFPISRDSALRIDNATQTHQLWTSASSALCACVNNPQNVECQQICVAAFPIIKNWLQQITMPCKEIFQPICSFIAMTVANNTCVQESFSASGSMEALSLVLVRQVSAAHKSLLSCQLSVTLSKTLSACIIDNPALASGLAQYGLVAHLISLLSSPNFDPDDRLSILLTLSHCTVATDEHQSQLVQCGGLPLIITFLTEDPSDEVRKAATFILQTCKQATMSLGVPGLLAMHVECENEPVSNMESFRSSARELLRKIDLLEKQQMKETKDGQEETDPPTADSQGQASLPQTIGLHLYPHKAVPSCRQTSIFNHVKTGSDQNTAFQTRWKFKKEKSGEMKSMSSNLNVEVETNARHARCSTCRGTGVLVSSHSGSLEGDREPLTLNGQLFKPYEPVRHSVPKESYSDKAELQGLEMSEAEQMSTNRCLGCVLPFEKVTSRTFASIQSSCRHSCEMHKILYKATERFRTHHCSLVFSSVNHNNTLKLTDTTSDKASPAETQSSYKDRKEVCLTPIHKAEARDKSCMLKLHWKRYKGITLTPLCRAKKKTLNPSNKTSPRLTPLKRRHLPGERR